MFRVNSVFSLITILVFCGVMTACTTIHIHNDGESKVKSYFGIVNISLDNPVKSIAISTEGVGVIFGYSSVTAGWLNEDVVAMKDGDCRAVFIIDNESQAKNIKEVLSYSDMGPNIGCLQ